MKILDYKLSFVLIFLIISGVMIFLFHTHKEKELKRFLKQQTQEAKNRYQGITFFPKNISDFIFSYLINTPEVINIFKDAAQADDFKKKMIRIKLYKHLEDKYKELRSYNIRQLHFHLPNNESFLRFHRPGKFGDNLTKARKTVAYVNQNKVQVEGFEEGKIFNGYRYVYPLFDAKDAHIGSVEISHSIASYISTYERSFDNIFLEVIIDKNVVKEKVFSAELKNYRPSVIHSQFMHLNSIKINKKIQHAMNSIKDRDDVKTKMNAYEDFSIVIEYEDHKGLVSFIVIQNAIDKKNVAYAMSFQRSQYLVYLYEEKKIQIYFLFFISFLITLILYYASLYNKVLRAKAYNDNLMNIYNRRFFEVYLTQSCKKQKRNDTPLSLIMFDVDDFKNINDTHGHDMGDISLKELAKIVKEHIRESDVFARWGGEEFMLVVEVPLAQAHKMAENLRAAIEKYTRENENIPDFTCSFGVLNLEGINSIEDAFKKVDSKLYEAKKRGKNKVVI